MRNHRRVIRSWHRFAYDVDPFWHKVMRQKNIVDSGGPSIGGVAPQWAGWKGQPFLTDDVKRLKNIIKGGAQRVNLGSIRQGIEVAHQHRWPAGMPTSAEFGNLPRLGHTLILSEIEVCTEDVDECPLNIDVAAQQGALFSVVLRRSLVERERLVEQ